MWTAPPGPAHSPETRTFSGTNTTPSGRVQLPTESRTTYLHDPYLNRSLNVADSNTLPTHQDFPTYQQESGITPDTQANPQAHQPTPCGGISASAPIPPLPGPAAHPVGDPCWARLRGSPGAAGPHLVGVPGRTPGSGVGAPASGGPGRGPRAADTGSRAHLDVLAAGGLPPSWPGPLIRRCRGAPTPLTGWPFGSVVGSAALEPWRVHRGCRSPRQPQRHGWACARAPGEGSPIGVSDHRASGLEPRPRLCQLEPAHPRRPDASGPAAGGPSGHHQPEVSRPSPTGVSRPGEPNTRQGPGRDTKPAAGGHRHPQGCGPNRKGHPGRGRSPHPGAGAWPGTKGYSKSIVNRATLGHPTRGATQGQHGQAYTRGGHQHEGKPTAGYRTTRKTVHPQRRRR